MQSCSMLHVLMVASDQWRWKDYRLVFSPRDKRVDVETNIKHQQGDYSISSEHGRAGYKQGEHPRLSKNHCDPGRGILGESASGVK